jgi:hypothetical protein
VTAADAAEGDAAAAAAAAAAPHAWHTATMASKAYKPCRTAVSLDTVVMQQLLCIRKRADDQPLSSATQHYSGSSTDPIARGFAGQLQLSSDTSTWQRHHHWSSRCMS